MYDDFERWMTDPDGQALSQLTATHYRRRIRQALEGLAFNPVQHTSEEVSKFIAGQGKSDSNHDLWVGAFKQYQAFLNHQGNPANFTAGLHCRRRPQRLPKPIYYDDLYRIFEAMPVDTMAGVRDMAMLQMLYCGLRTHELCSATVRSYRNFEVRVIGKANKERIVPINDIAWEWVIRYALWYHWTIRPVHLEGPEHADERLEWLGDQFETLRESLLDKDCPMFNTESGPMYTRYIRSLVAKATKRAGLNYRISPHMFRHSFITHTLDNGATDPYALMDVSGHEDMRAHRMYVKTSRRGRFDRVLAFHPFQRGIKPLGYLDPEKYKEHDDAHIIPFPSSAVRNETAQEGR